MTSKLLNGITRNVSYTENGAKTNSTTLHPVLDLFFLAGASRELHAIEIMSKLSLAYRTDRELTLKLIFWAGDIRKGIGERRFFQTCLQWLWDNHRDVVIANLDNIPFYNRYDSLFAFEDDRVYNYIRGKLKEGDKLLCKWLPRKKQYNNLASRLRKYLGLTPKQYRKLLVENTQVVETPMCKKEFGSIKYKQVPSVAFKKYRKSFKKNDTERFVAFLQDVKEGKTKINAGSIFPHDIIKEYMRNQRSNIKDAINAQWDCLPNLIETTEKILPVCDVSESMYDSVGSIFVSIALGIYISERNEGIFKDSFITFSCRPSLHTLKGTVCDRVDQMGKLIAYNTDVIAVFELILKTALDNKLTQEDMPDKVLMISDMEFDQGCKNNDANAFEVISQMYAKAGYRRPDLVFWNVNSSSTSNFPVQSHETGTALVSGYSPNIIKSVLNGSLSPVQVVLDTLNDERYDRVKVG